MTKSMEQRLQMLINKCMQRILKIWWPTTISKGIWKKEQIKNQYIKTSGDRNFLPFNTETGQRYRRSGIWMQSSWKSWRGKQENHRGGEKDWEDVATDQRSSTKPNSMETWYWCPMLRWVYKDVSNLIIDT